MPRPKPNTDSAYDVAQRFLTYRYGPRPKNLADLNCRAGRLRWDEDLSLAIDAIDFAQKEAEKHP